MLDLRQTELEELCIALGMKLGDKAKFVTAVQNTQKNLAAMLKVRPGTLFGSTIMQ